MSIEYISAMKAVSVLLFPDFETLDVFGPVEILGRLKDQFKVTFYSENGGLISNEHGVSIATLPLESLLTEGTYIFLIPGGHGTRKEVSNTHLIELIQQLYKKSQYFFTVCTGSGLLAKTGLLDGRKATSNKKAFAWAMSQGPSVLWDQKARWTIDGNIYTSAGVSAGMDMTLGFLADTIHIDFARKVAYQIEYDWQENKEEDHFWQQIL